MGCSAEPWLGNTLLNIGCMEVSCNVCRMLAQILLDSSQVNTKILQD